MQLWRQRPPRPARITPCRPAVQQSRSCPAPFPYSALGGTGGSAALGRTVHPAARSLVEGHSADNEWAPEWGGCVFRGHRVGSDWAGLAGCAVKTSSRSFTRSNEFATSPGTRRIATSIKGEKAGLWSGRPRLFSRSNMTCGDRPRSLGFAWGAASDPLFSTALYCRP
jgi:hypothetical protein